MFKLSRDQFELNVSEIECTSINTLPEESTPLEVLGSMQKTNVEFLPTDKSGELIGSVSIKEILLNYAVLRCNMCRTFRNTRRRLYRIY